MNTVAKRKRPNKLTYVQIGQMIAKFDELIADGRFTVYPEDEGTSCAYTDLALSDQVVVSELGEGFELSNINGYRLQTFGKFRRQPATGVMAEVLARVALLEEQMAMMLPPQVGG